MTSKMDLEIVERHRNVEISRNGCFLLFSDQENTVKFNLNLSDTKEKYPLHFLK